MQKPAADTGESSGGWRFEMTDRFLLIPAEASPTGEEAVYDAEREELIFGSAE